MASVAGVTGRQHPLPHMPPGHVQGHPNGQQDTLVLNLSDEDLAARTLYVGNLPFRVRWQDLKDLFRKVGTVARADVALWPDNRSKGHGNVVFSSPSDVQVAKGKNHRGNRSIYKRNADVGKRYVSIIFLDE